MTICSLVILSGAVYEVTLGILEENRERERDIGGTCGPIKAVCW